MIEIAPRKQHNELSYTKRIAFCNNLYYINLKIVIDKIVSSVYLPIAKLWKTYHYKLNYLSLVN